MEQIDKNRVEELRNAFFNAQTEDEKIAAIKAYLDYTRRNK